ncbi:MAG: hypothetical protein C5B50_29835 [Verrucomicrobia bacterium]|nr:MAG: hypothetical protein C5B50_29835 [Verrucomicrobiota bacterium]
MQTAVLEDFIDQEVVDIKGKPVGVLECYWESHSGKLYLGIKPKGQDTVRVVPGATAEVDERHSWVQLGFDASRVRTAPLYDCDKELYPKLEQAADHHFRH